MMAFYFSRLVEIYPFFLKGLWMTVVVSGIQPDGAGNLVVE